MARCSLAKPLGGTTTAAPHHSHRRGLLPTSAAASPIMTTRTQRLSALSKSPKSPPLFPRPKLPIPIPTTSNDTPTNRNEENTDELSTDAMSSRSSSGAGDVLRLMDALCVAPDEDVYISLLRDSVNVAEVAAVHSHIKRSAFGLPLPLANRLLLAYASCGSTVAARKVFDEMAAKNGITWATMVSAYSDACFHDEAIRLFSCMCYDAQELAGDLHDHAIVAVLRSCARSSKLSFGEQVHALLVKTKGVCGDAGSSLLQLYCESNRHDSARQVVETMRCSSQEPIPEAAWTSFMAACHRHGLLDEAMHVFRDMVSSGVARSSFSLSSILAVCAESEKHHRCYGQQAHADAVKQGVGKNQFVVSGLVHMYAKQGRLAEAARAFQEVGGEPDAVCWNAMAMGYARGGWYREAARMMYQMKAAGIDHPGLNVVRMACSR
uniref:Uncharacterized protein n=1 Tax=Avena sativa TaxID=4498 RepID=A0ACD5W2V4_AVESA